VIPASWLQNKITIAQTEKEYPGITDDRKTRFPEAAKPFGFQQSRDAAGRRIVDLLQPNGYLGAFGRPRRHRNRTQRRSHPELCHRDELTPMQYVRFERHRR
jgi:hypothetical protein